MDQACGRLQANCATAVPRLTGEARKLCNTRGFKRYYFAQTNTARAKHANRKNAFWCTQGEEFIVVDGGKLTAGAALTVNQLQLCEAGLLVIKQ